MKPRCYVYPGTLDALEQFDMDGAMGASTKPTEDQTLGLYDENQVNELRFALIAATSMVRDLVMDWPRDELCQSPEEAMTRLTHLVPDHEVEPLQ